MKDISIDAVTDTCAVLTIVILVIYSVLTGIQNEIMRAKIVELEKENTELRNDPCFGIGKGMILHILELQERIKESK